MLASLNVLRTPEKYTSKKSNLFIIPQKLNNPHCTIVVQ